MVHTFEKAEGFLCGASTNPPLPLQAAAGKKDPVGQTRQRELSLLPQGRHLPLCKAFSGEVSPVPSQRAPHALPWPALAVQCQRAPVGTEAIL
jgi:hypothetical protein